MLSVSVVFCLLVKTIICFKTVSDKEYVSIPILFYQDDYDRCMMAGFEFCEITFGLLPNNSHNKSQVWNIIETLNSNPSNYRHDILRYGICVRDACPELIKYQNWSSQDFRQKMEACYNKKFKYNNITVYMIKHNCHNKQSSSRLSKIDRSYGILITFYSAFVLLLSLYDIVAKTNSNGGSPGKVQEVIAAFSISKNWRDLSRISLENNNIQVLKCFQGIRLYNMIVIIITHTVWMNVMAPLANPQFTETFNKQFIALFPLYLPFSMQLFFMMSSWLLAYRFFLKFGNKKKIPVNNLILMFLKRYIRLTPALAVVVGFESTYMQFMGNGPIWDHMVGREHERCRKYWWTTLLYISNFVERNDLCVPQTWYLTVNTQYYLLSLVLLLLMWKNQKKICLILATVLVFHITYLFTIVYKNNWKSIVTVSPERLYNGEIFKSRQGYFLYASIYGNLAGFVAGLAYGYLSYMYRLSTLQFRKVSVTYMWISTSILCFGMIGLLFYAHLFNRLFSALYVSICRSVFIFSFGAMIFAITQGYGYRLRKICEWYPSLVLGRLTYGAYLIHTTLQRMRIGTRRSTIYVTNSTLIFESISDITIAFLGGLLLTLFFEMPFTKLERIFCQQHINSTGTNSNFNSASRSMKKRCL